jgi:hypothetical protein
MPSHREEVVVIGTTISQYEMPATSGERRLENGVSMHQLRAGSLMSKKRFFLLR